MLAIDSQHMAVDRASCGEIVGAESADFDSCSVVVVRKYGDEVERVTKYFPAGIAIVRRR